MVITPAHIGAGAAVFSAIFGAVSSSSAASANRQQLNDQRKYNKQVADLKLAEQISGYRYQLDAIEIAKANYQNEQDFQKQIRIDNWKQENQQRVDGYNDAVKLFNATERAYEEQVDFNEISAGVAKRDAARVLNEQYQDLAFQAEELRNNLADFRESSDLQKARLDLQEQRAEDTADIDRSRVAAELDVATDQFDTASRELAALTDAGRMKVAEQLRQERTRSLLEEGTARASGAAGRSAMKVQNSIMAQSALAQQSVVDALMSNEYMSSIEKTKLVNNLQSSVTSAGLNIRAINNTLAGEAEQRNADRLGISLKDAQMVRSMGLDTRKLSASMTSANDQYDSDISQIDLDQFAADVAADNARLTEPVVPREIPKPIKPPQTIFQDPLKPDFDAIRKLNKKAGKALVSNPGAQLATSASQVLAGISQATSILAANRPEQVTPPQQNTQPTNTATTTTSP
tara:strand:+ start:7205 stop:8584 length:1380 start_codon:yes stop_codon:yes gene_type:complete